ncbi:MAG: phosphotransferase enzyme family protein [Acidimicrobiales bacterium]
MNENVKTVASWFPDVGVVKHVERREGGHIHDTWFVSGTGTPPGAVLQRLNDHVFPDCARMMDNVVRVVAHLHGPLSVLRTGDGSVLAYDGEDTRPWRAFVRIEGAASPEVVESPEEALEVGRGLGRFLVEVQDLDGPALEEPIPGFKDFRRRRHAFEVLVDDDPYGRAMTCEDEIAAVRGFHRLVDELASARADGRLQTRIVHNDAKADNVLLDEDTGEAVCVIDLDTVAPGTVLFDIGDLLRSATVTAPEDDTDLGTLGVRDNLLEAALQGYLAEAGPVLTDAERRLIPLAGPLMAYENALRFLTDHLAGDSYFRIERPRHNLDRARAQLRVLEALDQAGDRVADLVQQS